MRSNVADYYGNKEKMMSKPEHWTIAKFLKGEASSAEEQEIERWIKASSDNQSEFNQLKLIWDSYEEKGSTFEPELSTAWNKIESEIELTSKFQISPWFYRVAAVLVLGLGITYFTFNQGDTELEPIATIESSEFKAQDHVEDFRLPDGTVVTLNKGATISYEANFGSVDRQVNLVGEAFFDVKRDEELPFVIKTSNTTTQVLGTSFSVSPIGEDVIVTVVSGKVSFKANDGVGNVLLTKGERGDYLHSTKAVTESANEDQNFLSWKTGKLSFEDATITQVMQDLERHYNVTIDLRDKNISRLTASFDNQPIGEVLGIVSSTLDIKIDQPTTDNYIISQ